MLKIECAVKYDFENAGTNIPANLEKVQYIRGLCEHLYDLERLKGNKFYISQVPKPKSNII